MVLAANVSSFQAAYHPFWAVTRSCLIIVYPLLYFAWLLNAALVLQETIQEPRQQRPVILLSLLLVSQVAVAVFVPFTAFETQDMTNLPLLLMSGIIGLYTSISIVNLFQKSLSSAESALGLSPSSLNFLIALYGFAVPLLPWILQNRIRNTMTRYFEKKPV